MASDASAKPAWTAGGSLSSTLNKPEAAAKKDSGGSARVVRHALAMAFGTSTSRVLGLVREVVFAALFPRAITDAWIAAFRLPNMFRRLLGEGSLAVSFVPVFVSARARDGAQDNEADGDESRALQGQESRHLLDGFFTLLVCLLTFITILGVLFPEPVLRVLLDADYIAQTEKFLTTVRMARIMFSFVFLICLYAFFTGVLNALGSYGLPAMAPTLFNVAMITSTLLPTGWFPAPGDGLAWGVIVGGFLQMAILIPALRKRGYLPKIKFQWNADIKKVLINMVPGLVGLGLLQITTLVNMRFASGLGEGPISWINWADRLLELPLSLVSVSLGSALLPTLADLWARNEKSKMAETLNFSLRLNMFACLAAASGLFALAEPIVRLIFEHGRFTHADTMATTGVVRVWALIMIPTASVRVLAPGYYAVKNTWFPALVSGICLYVHLTIAPIFMHEWGLTGLNFSSFTSSFLNFFLLMSFYQLLVSKFDYLKILKQFLKFLVPAAALIGAVQIYSPLHGILGDSFVVQVVILGVAIAAGGLAYGVASWLMGLQEWQETAQRLLKKTKR